MAFRKNNQQQISLNDRLNHLSERERRFLSKSWAKPFGDTIFPMIDEDKFAVLFCEDNGRPPTPVNVQVGSLFLQELTGINDEELVDSVVLDPRFQYALRLTSCDEIPYSDRTPSRFRERLYRHELETGEDLLKEEVERLAGEFAKLLKIHGNLKRMDSFMVSSSCKRMGRLELMYTCVSNLVKALVKAEEGHRLDEHLLIYADDSHRNAYCYRLKVGEAQTRLEALTKDAFLVYEQSAYAQSGTDEFQLLERMLFDQTKDGKLKFHKEISPKSLQNPSDEDATFRRKNGVGYQGYVANVVEDCGENGNIITQYSYDVNIRSDIDFCKEAIEKMDYQEKRTVLITDGAFASEENFKLAEKNNIELVPTTLTGKEPPKIVNQFHIDDGEIKTCPAGYTPVSAFYNEDTETYCAYFNKEVCDKCPYKNECPSKIQRKRATVKITQATINRAAFVEKLSTEQYKEYARKRNAVEGVPSVMRRRYGIDDMPVRGLLRSKMRFGFKVGATNIKRVIKASQEAVVFEIICFFKRIFKRNNYRVHPCFAVC